MQADYPLHLLACEIELPLEPNPTILVPAIADALNLPLSPMEQQNYYNDSFVDDNGISAPRHCIKQAQQQSVVAAFILFGWPSQDCRNSCMAANKWDPVWLAIWCYFLVISLIAKK